MSKQTAVKWLAKELESYGDPQVCEITWKDLDSLVEQAKQMEKEQKIELLKFSREMCTPDAPIDYVLNEFNKYYNETFNTKEK